MKFLCSRHENCFAYSPSILLWLLYEPDFFNETYKGHFTQQQNKETNTFTRQQETVKERSEKDFTKR